MKPIRIEADSIVFTAVLDKGVPIVPVEMEEMATKLAQRINNTISVVGGNVHEVWFYFDHDITEEEAELLAE